MKKSNYNFPIFQGKILGLILALFIFNYSLPAFSQVQQEWATVYNGPGNGEDVALSIAVDGSGNVYVTGYSWGGAGTNQDYATIKYNSSGVQQWAARYNGPSNGDDEAFSIAVDGSGNVYVTGFSLGTWNDYATIKYNSSGVQQWAVRYNGPGNDDDNAYSIAVDGAGNVYVTGSSKGAGTSDDYATIKYNSSGVQQWVQRYNGPGNLGDYGKSIAVDGSGNVYVTGHSYGGTGTNQDYATIKYNSSGVQQWLQRYDGQTNGNDKAYSIAIDGSGNVYVTGESQWSGLDVDYATVKYNSSGVEQWASGYNGPVNGQDIAYSISVDGSQNVYVTGVSGGDLNYDYATIKYNLSGVQQWAARYDGGHGDDIAYSIAVDGSGNSYVTGKSLTNPTADYDFATIKYNSTGDQQWESRLSGNGNDVDEGRSIAVDGSGNVYVTGVSTHDYATIKFSQPIGIQPISNLIPKKYQLGQNYPNPFNPSTNIEFAVKENGFVKLSVYNTLGQVVSVLVNQELKAGTYKADFDGSNFPSGVYYYAINAGSYNETKKMVLIK